MRRKPHDTVLLKANALFIARGNCSLFFIRAGSQERIAIIIISRVSGGKDL
jgi:hypothetical protein